MRSSLLVVGALLLGCAFSSASFAEGPERGGTLVVTTRVEPASLDPLFGNSPANDRRIFNQFYENLLYQNANGEFAPKLATSWEFQNDGASIVFELRPDVVFHDGTPMDAEAVAFNFNRLADPEVNARARQFLPDLVSAEAIGELTVRVDFANVSATNLVGLANEAGSIASPAAIKANPSSFGRNPVGTGPFRFVSWTSGNEIVAERFDAYWDAGEDGEPLPYLDRVRTRFIVDDNSKIIEAQAGTVHVTDQILPRDYERVEQDGSLRLVDGIVSNFQIMHFNLTRPPFDDETLRRAFVHAINRDLIVQVVTGGHGEVQHGLEPSQSPWHNQNLKDYEHNPELARQYYEESGHSGPIQISMIQRPQDTQIAQIIQAQMAEIGVDLRIEALERLAWGDKVYGHQYQTALSSMSAPKVDPDINFGAYYARTGGANHSGHTDEVIWDLLERARLSLDPVERKALYDEFQQYHIDNAYQLPLISVRARNIVREEVQGLEYEVNDTWLLGRVWLSGD